MASKMMISIALLLLTPALVTATSFEYYRSVFCDAQSPDFFLEKYTSPVSLIDDKLCHQTPARTMAMKIADGLDPACVVLAYDDYECQSLVGSVPASGRCVAATKAKIGSWQAVCNTTDASSTTSFVPGELKRRGKARLPKAVDEYTVTISVNSTTCTADSVATASSTVIEVSSNISASANETGVQTTSSPTAGAALSSAISSGAGFESNTSTYAIASATSSTKASTLASRTMTSSPTVTYIGNTSSNGTATLYKGTATSNQIASGWQLLCTIASGMIVTSAAMILL